MTSIGGYAFQDCSSLTSIAIPDSLNSIGTLTFYYCSSLTSIMIPDSVTEIGYAAFCGCSSLTNISLPNSVIYIDNSAFQGCSSLTNISLPNSVIYIDNSAFQGCSSLTSISIPDSVIFIGNSVFQDCDSLTSITLPDSVTSIGSYAFKGCGNLRHVVIPGNARPAFSATRLPSRATICCYEFTDVEEWAKSNGFRTVLLGDMDINQLLDFFLEAQDAHIPVGENTIINPYMFPIQENPVIQWSSSAPEVASVANGVVTAHSKGNATITAVLNGIGASVDIEVYIAATDIDFPDEIWVIAKESTEIPILIYPANADAFLYFSVENEAMSVSRSGSIVTITSGNIPNDYTLGIYDWYNSDIYHECLVHVCHPVTAVAFDDSVKSMVAGQTARLIARVTAYNRCLVNKLVSFASSDESVAKVDENGMVTAVAPGTATITAAAGSGITAACTITVRDADTLMLPASLTTVGEGAFAGADMEVVILPDGAASIASRAFADCGRLTVVYMPDSITFIAEDAFEGSENIRFICASGSTAAAYAAKHNIPCSIG